MEGFFRANGNPNLAGSIIATTPNDRNKNVLVFIIVHCIVIPLDLHLAERKNMYRNGGKKAMCEQQGNRIKIIKIKAEGWSRIFLL